MIKENKPVKKNILVCDLRIKNAELEAALKQAQQLCIQKEKKSIEYIYHIGQFKSNVSYRLFSKLFNLFKSNKSLVNFRQEETLQDTNIAYLNWLSLYEIIDDTVRKKIKAHILTFDKNIKFTLIIDCRESNYVDLMKSLKSFVCQIYNNLEIILCVEENKLKDLEIMVASAVDEGLAIKYITLSIDDSFKDLLLYAESESAGDFVSFFCVGAKLHETALYEFVAEINLYQETDAVYADEDEFDNLGGRCAPYFKTDWNLELFLAQNYLGNFYFIRAQKLFSVCSSLKKGEDLEAANFRALLSLARKNIRHIPAVLYHFPTSMHIHNRTRRTPALAEEYFLNSNVKAQVARLPENSEWLEVKRVLSDHIPLVTVIIPTRNRPDLLRVSLRGVLAETEYKNIEVIIVDHENDHPEVLEIFKTYLNDDRVTIMPYKGEFNHSAMNNRASEIAQGEILLFLNDDVEVIEPTWLYQIVSQFTEPNRGVVGARLLYPSGEIQHAGIVLGLGGVAGHGHVGLMPDDKNSFGRCQLAREVSAVTGACMAIERDLFEEVGGFSETYLKRTFNDVDLCLKVLLKGRVNIFNPRATLIHHESATGGADIDFKQFMRLQQEISCMLDTWGLLQNDPYYNVNLSLNMPSFSLSSPPRRIAPWNLSY